MVEPKGREGLGPLAPLDLVDASAGEVRLQCTLADFEHLDPAEEIELVPGSGGYAAYGPQQVSAWPYYGLTPGAETPGGVDLAVAGFSPPLPTTVFRSVK